MLGSCVPWGSCGAWCALLGWCGSGWRWRGPASGVEACWGGVAAVRMGEGLERVSLELLDEGGSGSRRKVREAVGQDTSQHDLLKKIASSGGLICGMGSYHHAGGPPPWPTQKEDMAEDELGFGPVLVHASHLCSSLPQHAVPTWLARPHTAAPPQHHIQDPATPTWHEHHHCHFTVTPLHGMQDPADLPHRPNTAHKTPPHHRQPTATPPQHGMQDLDPRPYHMPKMPCKTPPPPSPTPRCST
ncbi:hypothetical protein EDB84DRAFT_1446940 [Lactarius hengduanensis]|nr:hypothetical protein EDB84DRAFT_1446940 [Lactarius hengduanensis]